MSAIDVKICGLKSSDAVEAAVDGGARYVGFVFFAASPRSVTPRRMAELAAGVPAGVTKVALVVDAADDALDDIVSNAPVDLLQLHGTESAGRVRALKRRFGLPVMKTVSIAGPADIDVARRYEGVADRLLFDAKAPAGATRPGGNALTFDWELLGGETWHLPWFLAGGLEAATLAEAVRVSGAKAVDVSSGVEDMPGVKNPAKIRAFLDAAARM
jgi:phosphoribosylanthranilate isomerase